MDNITEWIGWIGAALVLGAYALLSFKKLESESFTYHGMNMAGSVLLAIYAYLHEAVASVAVNIIWTGIGLFASYQIAKRLKLL